MVFSFPFIAHIRSFKHSITHGFCQERATYAAATVNKEEFIFTEVYFELHDLLPCQCILCTVTDVKKRPKVGQAALPVDKVGATCWIRLNVNSFLENALQLKLFRTCPTEKESVSCTAATFKSINSISDTLSYALPLAAVWNLNGSGNSIIFIEITCMYEGFIGVIALTVLGVSVDSCRLSKENVFRELTLISSFVTCCVMEVVSVFQWWNQVKFYQRTPKLKFVKWVYL